MTSMVSLACFAFLAWMKTHGPSCASIIQEPTLIPFLPWCQGPGWIAGFSGYVGVAACSDENIFIVTDEDTHLHASSVAEMQGILRA